MLKMMSRIYQKFLKTLHCYENLPDSEEDKATHIDTLKKLLDDDEHRNIFDHLYETLTILDTKSASLLQANAIVIAVFTIFLANKLVEVALYAIYLGLFLSITSSFYLLSILWVHWSATDELRDLEKHGRILLDIRIARTIRYRMARQLAFMSLGVLVISFILSI